MKEIGHMLGRMKKSLRTRKNRMRNLRLEGLEDRKLLAGDIVNSLPYHNPLIAQDVDYDFNVSPRDVLMIVNELNAQGSRELGSDPVDADGKAFIDVNGDGAVSPIDALAIVNFLNGEGETDPLVTYTAQLTDTAGNPVTSAVLGQTFRLNVFVQDTRSTGPTGVFQNAIDVGLTGDGDVEFPLGTGSFLSNIQFGSSDPAVNDEYTAFPNGRLGDAANRATEFLNEIGATWSDFFNAPQPEGGVYPLFSTEFRAEVAGTVNFVLNQHELAEEPTSQVNVYDPTSTLPDSGRIDPSMIMYQTVSINVISDPTAPTAVDDTVDGIEDTDLALGSANLTANDTVINGALTIVSIDAIQGTTQGTVNGTTYSPPANFFGIDTVTYTVQDEKGLQSTATVTISVAPVNDAPTAVADTFSVDEESTDNPLDVLANDSPGPNEASDTLTVVSVTAASNGTVTISADGSNVLYTPNADFIGSDSFTYVAEDSSGVATASTNVSIEIEATVLPRARRDSATVDEDSSNNSIAVLSNDRANAGATVFLVGVASAPANGQVSVDDNNTPGDASDDTILYTPNGNFSGTDTFTYTMNDTATGSVASTGTVNVTVNPVNDPVELVDDTASTSEDQAATIAISALLSNDSPGDGETDQQSLTLNSVAALTAGGGTVAIVGSNVVYTPADDFNGEFLFTYNASDNGDPSSSATATVTVDVTPINDDPTAADDSASTSEDTSLTIAMSTLLANDIAGPSNESAQTLSVTGVSAASAQGGTVTMEAAGVVYTPSLNFNGNDSFTYTISDGAGGSATGTVTVSVSPVNDAPTGVADSVRAFKNNALNITANELLANDSTGPADESGQTLSIGSVSNASNGTVVLNADGSVTFTPTPEFTGAASFDYVARDSEGGDSSPITVSVTVEEFVPTDVAGTVWVDENNNGAVDTRERRLGGVKITLTGTSLGQTITPTTLMTLSDGSYSFEDLGPGQYVVSLAAPQFTIDGRDMPGLLGDADIIENQFTINVAQPGGADATDYNFGVRGISGGHGRILDQLASRYTGAAGRYDGAVFALGANNEARWGSLLDGFEGVEFAEAALSNDGSQLVLTIVSEDQTIQSAVLNSTQFVKLAVGSDTLVRVIGDSSSFNWETVSSDATPPISVAGYLDSVDDIFAQEGWDE